MGARFAAQDLKLESIYITHDETLYGQGVAENFRNEAEKFGLNVLAYDGTEERANFAPNVYSVESEKSGLGLLWRHLSSRWVAAKTDAPKGSEAALMGPDGLDSSQMVKIAGHHVTGSYYTTVTTVAGPPDTYPETAAFAKKFKQRFGKKVESFAMYGYDAAQLGIKAVEQTLQANGGKKPSRQDVLRQCGSSIISEA